MDEDLRTHFFPSDKPSNARLSPEKKKKKKEKGREGGGRRTRGSDIRSVSENI